MQTLIKNKKVQFLTLAILVLIVSFISIRVALNERLQELQLETKVLIGDQETLLSSIVVTTARNGADEITESIIKDCSLNERNRFDELLSKLDAGLPRAELIELERLFGRCGAFYAQRKSVMVSRLVREIEILQMLVGQLSNLTDTDVSVEYKLKEWKELSSLEQKQSRLFSELVDVQDRIISSLLEGKTPSSPEMVAILQEARDTQQELAVTNTQTATIRSGLVPL